MMYVACFWRNDGGWHTSYDYNPCYVIEADTDEEAMETAENFIAYYKNEKMKNGGDFFLTNMFNISVTNVPVKPMTTVYVNPTCTKQFNSLFRGNEQKGSMEGLPKFSEFLGSLVKEIDGKNTGKKCNSGDTKIRKSDNTNKNKSKRNKGTVSTKTIR